MTDIYIIKTHSGTVTADLFMQIAAPVMFLRKRLEVYEVSECCWYDLERRSNKAFEFVVELDDVYIEESDEVYFGLRPGNLDSYINNPAGNC